MQAPSHSQNVVSATETRRVEKKSNYRRCSSFRRHSAYGEFVRRVKRDGIHKLCLAIHTCRLVCWLTSAPSSPSASYVPHCRKLASCVRTARRGAVRHNMWQPVWPNMWCIMRTRCAVYVAYLY